MAVLKGQIVVEVSMVAVVHVEEMAQGVVEVKGRGVVAGMAVEAMGRGVVVDVEAMGQGVVVGMAVEVMGRVVEKGLMAVMEGKALEGVALVDSLVGVMAKVVVVKAREVADCGDDGEMEPVGKANEEKAICHTFRR